MHHPLQFRLRWRMEKRDPKVTRMTMKMDGAAYSTISAMRSRIDRMRTQLARVPSSSGLSSRLAPALQSLLVALVHRRALWWP